MVGHSHGPVRYLKTADLPTEIDRERISNFLAVPTAIEKVRPNIAGE